MLLVAMIFLIGCSKKEEKHDNHLPETSKEVISDQNLTEEKKILQLNSEVLALLKAEKYEKLSSYIHPLKGVQFSMYSYVSDGDKVFSKLDFEKFVKSDIRFTFGEKDGLAEKYVVSLEDYFAKWVFKKDFTKAKINYKNFEGTGNTKNNIEEKFPSSIAVENYIKGTAEYSYMDWNSLILVFEKMDDAYFLVAIANNQWTI